MQAKHPTDSHKTAQPTVANPLKPRLDRIYPLAESVTYPGSPFADMVIFIPPCPDPEKTPLRVWLHSPAEDARVCLGNKQLTPVGRARGDAAWNDYGSVCRADPCFGTRGFTILKVYGIPSRHLAAAAVLITPQVDLEPAADLEAVERQFWGLSRAAAGSTTLTPNSAPVGSPAAFAMTYTAGPDGLPAGALLRLAFPKAFTLPDPGRGDGPGALNASGAATLELYSLDTSIESHERTDVIYRLCRPLAPGGELVFRYLSDFTYLFPMQWAEAERRYWYSHLPPMSVAVAVDERRIFVPPLPGQGHAFRTLPGPATRLHLFLPGRVREGTPITLRGRFTDRFRNAPGSGPIPADISLHLDGPQPQKLGGPAGHLGGKDRFDLPLGTLPPGVYRVTAEDNNGRTVARSNPLEIMPANSNTPAIRWGEIHGHSEQSDGSGDYSSLFAHARQDGCLDFAAAADHACYFSDNEWLWMQDTANSHDQAEHFVTLPGYEWAGKQGHRNVYTSRNRLDLFRGMACGSEQLSVVYAHFLGDEQVVAGPHTRHTGDFFAGHVPEVQRFLEIYSMWGTFEDLAFDVLNRGAVIGLTGGGDCHEGRVGFSVEDPTGQGRTPHTFAPGLRYRCGMTAALLDDLSRKGLLQALRHRAIYATTGARILLDATLNGTPMGGRARRTNPLSVSVTVHAEADIQSVDLIRNGTVIHTWTPGKMDAALTWQGRPAGMDPEWYLLRVTQADGQRAWSSPFWLHAAETTG